MRTALILASALIFTACGAGSYNIVKTESKVGGTVKTESTVSGTVKTESTVTMILRFDISACNSIEKTIQSKCISDMLAAYASLGDLSAFIAKEVNNEKDHN